jgi:predicted alpha/beta hydrolase
VAALDDLAEQLMQLIRLHAEAAVQMRSYMPLFFGGGGLPPEVYPRWNRWGRGYEKIRTKVVAANMEPGYLDVGNPVIATRLIGDDDLDLAVVSAQ